MLGAAGFLGGNISEHFETKGHTVVKITRGNYSSFRDRSFELLVNANGNSRKFWANSNPLEDFDASVLSVQRSLFDFEFGMYVFISTSDVYHDHKTKRPSESDAIEEGKLMPYGFHKFLAEKLVSKYAKNYLILRCAALIGKHLAKGVVKDILDDRPLYVDPTSMIQFITTDEVANIILQIFSDHKTREIVNVGGISNSGIREIAQILNKRVKFRENAPIQYYNMDVFKLQSQVKFPIRSSTEYVKEFALRERPVE